MAITNSADVLEAHMPRVKKTHVILEYGKPIYPNELEKETKKKLGAYCQKMIAEMLVKNRNLCNRPFTVLPSQVLQRIKKIDTASQTFPVLLYRSFFCFSILQMTPTLSG